GVFTVTVPKNFGDQKLTWTLTANGKTTSIPVSLNPLWVISPFTEAGGNTPPFIGFSESGPFLQGPPRGFAQTLDATVGTPLPLNTGRSDDGKVPPAFEAFAKMTPMASVPWSLFRGPADVKFASAKPKVEKTEYKAPAAYAAKSSTTATFNEPGDYILE